MLYERWQQVAHECQRETALIDASLGKRWTFAQLAQVCDSARKEPSGVSFPQGISTEFIFSVLRAWRTGNVVCPLEDGQRPATLTDLLPGCIHLKTTSASTGL